jgi:hypothetical protein
MTIQVDPVDILGLSPETAEYVRREAARLRDSLRDCNLIESYRAAASQSYLFRSIDKAVLSSIRDAVSSLRTSVPVAPLAVARPEERAVLVERRRGRPRKYRDEDDRRLARDWKQSDGEKGEFEKGRGLQVGAVKRAQDRIRKREEYRRGENRTARLG